MDTNVLLYAVNPDASEYERCRGLLEEWRSGARPWFITWPIAYEFMRVSTHRSVFPSPLTADAAMEFVSVVLESPGVDVLIATPRHGSVMADILGSHPRLSGNVFHDVHTAALMREHGVKEIWTADTDFHQFSFLDVRSPFSEG